MVALGAYGGYGGYGGCLRCTLLRDMVWTLASSPGLYLYVMKSPPFGSVPARLKGDTT